MAANLGQYKTTYLTDILDEKSTDVEGVGCLRLEGGKLYRWVLLNTGVTATVATVVNGAVGFLATDTSLTTVCTDVTDCFAGVAAGVTLAAGLTTAYYIWIQVGGISGALANNVGSAGTAAVGEAVCLSTADNTFLERATATQPISGIITDVTASANLVYLTCPT
jgi:hypothetical protein